MQEIPDTGGGLSGFIAWLLWRVYQYFPFEGTWDWLLLFIFLAVLTRVGAMPSSRKLIKWMTSQRDLSDADPRWLLPYLHNLFTQTGVMLVFMWFFSTDAANTFLAGRTCFGEVSVLEVSSDFAASSFVYFLGAGFAFLVGAVVSLAVLHIREQGPEFVFFLCSFFHAVIVLCVHMDGRHLSIASFVLMWVFTLADWVVVFGLVWWIGLRRKRGKT